MASRYDKAFHEHATTMRLTNWSVINNHLYHFCATGAFSTWWPQRSSKRSTPNIWLGFIADWLQVLEQWSLFCSFSLLLVCSLLQLLWQSKLSLCLFSLCRNFKNGSKMRVSFLLHCRPPALVPDTFERQHLFDCCCTRSWLMLQ